jgi:WD40 repeat protein
MKNNFYLPTLLTLISISSSKLWGMESTQEVKKTCAAVQETRAKDIDRQDLWGKLPSALLPEICCTNTKAKLLARPLGYIYENEDVFDYAPTHPKHSISSSFNPHNHHEVLLALGSKGGIVIWDIAQNTCVKKVREFPFSSQGVTTAWSPDGNYLAITNNYKGYIEIHDLTDNSLGKRLWSPGIGLGKGLIKAIAFSPDSQMLAATYTNYDFNTDKRDTQLILWDVTTSQKIDMTLANDQAAQYSTITFSKDGQYIFIGMYNELFKPLDAEGNEIQQWTVTQTSTGRKLVKLSAIPLTQLYIQSLHCDNKNKYLMAHSDDGVHVWDMATHKLLYCLKNEPFGIITGNGEKRCAKLNPEYTKHKINAVTFNAQEDGIIVVKTSGKVEHYSFKKDALKLTNSYSICPGYILGSFGSFSADKQFFCGDSCPEIWQGGDSERPPHKAIVAQLKPESRVHSLSLEALMLIEEALHNKQWNNRLLKLPLNKFAFYNLTQALNIDLKQADELWQLKQAKSTHPATLPGTIKKQAINPDDIHPASR